MLRSVPRVQQWSAKLTASGRLWHPLAVFVVLIQCQRVASMAYLMTILSCASQMMVCCSCCTDRSHETQVVLIPCLSTQGCHRCHQLALPHYGISMLGLQQSMLELSLVALGLTIVLLLCLCLGNALLQIHCSVHCCSVVPCMNPVSATMAAVTWVWGSGVGTVPTSHVQLNAGVLDSVVGQPLA